MAKAKRKSRKRSSSYSTVIPAYALKTQKVLKKISLYDFILKITALTVIGFFIYLLVRVYKPEVLDYLPGATTSDVGGDSDSGSGTGTDTDTEKPKTRAEARLGGPRDIPWWVLLIAAIAIIIAVTILFSTLMFHSYAGAWYMAILRTSLGPVLRYNEKNHDKKIDQKFLDTMINRIGANWNEMDVGARTRMYNRIVSISLSRFQLERLDQLLKTKEAQIKAAEEAGQTERVEALKKAADELYRKYDTYVNRSLHELTEIHNIGIHQGNKKNLPNMPKDSGTIGKMIRTVSVFWNFGDSGNTVSNQEDKEMYKDI